MSFTITISLYSTVKSASLRTVSMSAEYPLVRNLSAFSTRCGVLTSPSRCGSSPSAAMSCRMRSCIGVFYIAVLAASAVVGAQADPDSLYRQRANVARAREAAAIWESRVAADPKDFESAWKLSRVMYWLGGHDAPDGRRPALERGVEAGRLAASLRPARPEGHFWMAATMGLLAESLGLR